jgi:hypothetical protein
MQEERTLDRRCMEAVMNQWHNMNVISKSGQAEIKELKGTCPLKEVQHFKC